jgi:hypothetical protein
MYQEACVDFILVFLNDRDVSQLFEHLVSDMRWKKSCTYPSDMLVGLERTKLPQKDH